MRDALAGEHMDYIVERQRPGKVLTHLHNAHLRRPRTHLPWYEFLPTGGHLDQLFGTRFAVIGGALGTSDENFIGEPETGSLEATSLARATKVAGKLDTKGESNASGAI